MKNISENTQQMHNDLPTNDGREIIIQGARVHNLKNIDLNIPRDQFIVFTGVSGSGKSSLAFDTLVAEGQRRFLATLSNGKPNGRLKSQVHVNHIHGLPPVVAIDSTIRKNHPRSSVASLTGTLDYLRILYSQAGVLHCPGCGSPLKASSISQIVLAHSTLPEKTKMLILAPQDGMTSEQVRVVEQSGYLRLRIAGEVIDASEWKHHDHSGDQQVEIVIDRLVAKPGFENRLLESVQAALRMGNGSLITSTLEKATWRDQFFSTKLACLRCDFHAETLEPKHFNWNHPAGSCLKCEGRGVLATAPTHEKPETTTICSDCEGTKLNATARAVRIANLTFPELLKLSISRASQWISNRIDQLSQDSLERPLLSQIQLRLNCLCSLGLDYLTLERATNTLSGGEYHRVKLAQAISTDFCGVCYILDEPTTGLDSREVDRLIGNLKTLVDRGNSLICVEHHPHVIQAADLQIEFGPGAGAEGGTVCKITSQPLQEIPDEELTPSDQNWQDKQENEWISLQDVQIHNLKQLSIQIPIGKMTCIVGPSGSGKTSLIQQSLVPLLKQALILNQMSYSESQLGRITILPSIQRILSVNQSPIMAHKRSCLATFSGAWDEIRKLYRQTKLAKIRGYRSSHFSFNSKLGQCPECKGLGIIEENSPVLGEISYTCPRCNGKRLRAEILSVKWKGKSLSDILSMSINEALIFFADYDRIWKTLIPLQELGMGYLTLGQSLTELSGGERQRVKLAAELSHAHPATVLVLDEPTQALSPKDINRLNQKFLQMVQLGLTLILITHDPQLLKLADWVIELGPRAGEAGGELIFSGPAFTYVK